MGHMVEVTEKMKIDSPKLDLLDYLTPNKFKIAFTLYALMFGGFFAGLILKALIGFQFTWGVSGHYFIGAIYDATSDLFSHFLLLAYGLCKREGGGNTDLACFFSIMLRVLIIQGLVFYLLSCTLYNQTRQSRFWRIYFFIIMIIHIRLYCGQISYPDSIGLNPAVFWFDLTATNIALLGLFLMAAEKRLFNPIFWRAFFVLYLVWDSVIMSGLLKPIILPEVIRRLMILLPWYVALYLYAFKFLRPKQFHADKKDG